jgi:hypothetical protein
VVHPLVAETIRYQAAGALAEGFSVAADLLAAAVGGLDEADPGDRVGWLVLLPHLGALLGLEVAVPAAVLARLADVAVRMSLALLWAGSYPTSLEIAESGLRRAAGLGGDHEQILALRFRRASARRFLGRAADAEAEYRQVLDARLRVLGTDHPSTLTTPAELGDRPRCPWQDRRPASPGP